MFWKVVWLLFTVRVKLTGRTFARSSAALAGVLLFTLVFGPAAFAAGSAYEHRFANLTPAHQGNFLWGSLLLIQAVWLLVLLFGGVAGVGGRLSPKVIKTYPLPPRAFVTATAFSSLADIPTLLVLPLFFAICHSLQRNGGTFVAYLPAPALIAAHIGGIEQVARSMVAQRQRRLKPLSLTFFGVTIALFLSALSAKEALMATAHGDILRQIIFLGLLLAQCVITIFIADHYTSLPDIASKTTTQKQRKNRTLTGEFTSPTFSRLMVAAAVDWRNLLINLPAHLPLRLPGQLMLGIFFGWIAPNLGNDALLDARDLCSMGGLLYFLIWQVQLLTNRFGSEAGTGALLFGFPVARREMLLVRNLTLLTLLVPLNGAQVTVICLLLHAPQAIFASIAVTLLTLILFTALGNIVSVVYPYPIARRTEGFFVEPDRSLLFLYGVLVALIAGLFWAVSPLSEPVRWSLLILVTAGLYVTSLYLGDRLLTRNEREIIARLDGD